MDMTYSEAVELLENYGVKISSECNGISVIRACAEIVRNQARALKKFTEQDKSLENTVSVLKQLRLHAKVMRIKDGDLLWFRADQIDHQILSRLKDYIKKLAKTDNVLVIATDRGDTLTQFDAKAQTLLMKRMLAQLRPDIRTQVLKELADA
jgi:hypothetical protein